MPPVGRGGRSDTSPCGHRGEVGMTDRPRRHYRSHSLPTTDPRSPYFSRYWHHSSRRPRDFLRQSPSLTSVPQFDGVRSSPKNTVREDKRKKTDIPGLNLLLSPNDPKAATIHQNYYPEGGWGWVVLVCALIFDVILSTLHLSAGFLIVEIRNQFLKGEESIQPVAVASVFLGVSQLLSPIVVALCKKKSTRLLAIFGAIVTSLGCLFTSFATQLHQVYLSYGIFIGSGNSLARETSSIMIGQYFKKRRQQVEMLSLIGYGFGVATMPLLFSYWVRLVGWRRGLQILAGIQCVVSLVAILFRPASLYHPQRRAILHIKSLQKRSKAKDKSYVVEKRPFIDFSVLNSRTVQILVIGSGITAFGISAPFIFLVEEMLKDKMSIKNIYHVNIYLGLACAAGSAIFGFIVIQNSAQCMIAKQYLCQSALFVLSVWLLVYPTLSGYYGYVLFAVVYGIFYGGYIYTLRLCVFDKVRARNFSRAWSFLLWTQAIPNVIGLPMIYYLNEVLGNKRGYYFSAAVVFLGSLFLFLIDVHKYQAQKKKQRDIEANAVVLEDPVQRPESSHETLFNGAIPKNYGDLRKAQELTCISEEILVENYLEDYIDDCITSCNKEEKYVMLSEFENNLYKTDESVERDGASCSQVEIVIPPEVQCCNKCARELATSENTTNSPLKGSNSDVKIDIIEEPTIPL
ncbi:monocarboxylate transporter 10-like [Argiope bruennichi]|uniref:Monocarboxylate transporter 8 like protein n=1 Tax=Argiope bruennichi TaxID=94029 RepID=A0A8T0FIT9_ARGBR|nr:monocarboxylate transporter 10-like [Argiope bruennichi]KAF8791174.1 Monocarboxylate transporter 8 like protein [Argiope bruennichi]